MPAETVRAHLTRRTGARAAEDELEAAAAGLVDGTREAEARYEMALERFTALGAGDLDARIDAVLDDLGLGSALADREVDVGVVRGPGGQGGPGRHRAVALLGHPARRADQRPRLRRACRRLQAWIGRRSGGMVVVSHDRAFLEQTVTTVLELDEHDHTAREFGGGWAGYPGGTGHGPAPGRGGLSSSTGRNRAGLRERANRQRQWATKGVATRDQVAPRQRQGPARLPDQPDREAGVQGPPDRAGAGRPRRGGEAVGGMGPALHHRAGRAGRGHRGPAERCGGRTSGRLPPRAARPRDRLGRPAGLDRSRTGAGKSTLVAAPSSATLPLASGERWVGRAW